MPMCGQLKVKVAIQLPMCYDLVPFGMARTGAGRYYAESMNEPLLFEVVAEGQAGYPKVSQKAPETQVEATVSHLKHQKNLM